ncbi:hypothetical protein Afer_1015 [Acidimicrobium ferrooxidans DSM 10331]|uniref:Carbohydrate kinase FGGY C-terminal domain-containing protein n=1 Tax=Acidimicrobium ferrooxidans (strain DSM 10331 / JCM 15462 / NBRC 103882 / ICP) TaxID=525909 RepID=C7LYZ5_ACIFD|nr:FGGY-family carbohydrate kinase [Acidimicrobium ferrooxidans]ACU53953.1 hypothetical protein Afer_1015 [Acidimicrobium ferrooxidans DSM 10331]
MVGGDEQRRGGDTPLVVVVGGARSEVPIDRGAVAAIVRLVGVGDLHEAAAIADEPSSERALVGRRGVLAGLSLTSDEPAIAGALIEGVAFEAARIVDGLDEAVAGSPEARILLEGLYAVSAVAQVVADVLGRAVLDGAGQRAMPGPRARSRRSRWRRWLEDQGSLT